MSSSDPFSLILSSLRFSRADDVPEQKPPSDAEKKEVQRVSDWCSKNSVAILGPRCPGYPRVFENLDHPPRCLFVYGRWPSKSRVSIVGSRKILPETRQWLVGHLGEVLKHHDIATCSGGAPGVDTEVHRLSLFWGRSTVVFLPSGMAQKNYWSKWMSLIEPDRGAVVSEYPPFHGILRMNFHQRNRLIAAASSSTLVVQAGLRSGSIMTGNLAASLGKNVGSIPGHPHFLQFQGCLKLLQEGAEIIANKSDIISLVES